MVALPVLLTLGSASTFFVTASPTPTGTPLPTTTAYPTVKPIPANACERCTTPGRQCFVGEPFYSCQNWDKERCLKASAYAKWCELLPSTTVSPTDEPTNDDEPTGDDEPTDDDEPSGE
ncbi:Aste57867_11973 [Aphanomyces stellatus]|uniref:Aste57867_11973 protein n=1 Tax=Aphanomyces stellatus TaxID=120398 RepID=A0A485KUS9_9STRA|nr:hypothetical protein As57867_011928 [Aphanomyces stellatus]VFT88828.1 Aste57867_11973 [Aphanomyces stellatus]